MVVFVVILAIVAKGLCYEELTIAQPYRPRPCPENEVYMKCRTICPPQFCNLSFTDYKCDEVLRCEPGCDCIKNYLRDYDGICVLNDNCPAPCGENQVPSDCADDYSDVPTIQVCRRGCRCVEGYTRNSYNQCVLIPPLLPCGKNEEPTVCRQTCPPQTCDWNPNELACKPGPCQPGCNCKKGYLRDKKGNCILQGKCPPILPQCGENEEPTDCAKNIRPGDSTLTIKCRPCQCIKNYMRDSNGVCVLTPRCGINEEPTNCGNSYPKPLSTDVVNVSRVRCLPGCKCIAGFVRNRRGVCVKQPISPVCGKFEEPNFCIAIFPSNCPPCRCIRNYVRNSKGVCVPRYRCGRNETYVPCIFPCPTNYCPKDDRFILIQCLIPFPCPGGCACKSNYTRISSEDQRCVLASDCPPIKCTGKNTVYNSCPSACFSEECGSLQLEPTTCNTLVPNVCRPRCVCRENYRRESSGNCIPIEQCPPQCGENEEPNYCAPIYYPQPIEGPVETAVIDQAAVKFVEAERIRCRPCKCIDGFIRDISGACVPKPVCGENEVSTNCKQECPPQDCNWDPTRMDCRPVECKPGCNCIEGYLRDLNGICIPRERCPECNGDPNAVYTQCPNQCISSCKFPNAICSQECGEPFGCKCRLGYIQSDEGRCILPTECPGGNPCGQNETYAPCLVGCPTNNCPRDDSLAIPQCSPPFPCPGGCACKSNYRRIKFEDRRCILASDCPPIKCTRKNEEYRPCPSACFSEACGTLQMEPKICNTLVPNVCRPRCVCRENYRRDSSGNCIPIEQCPRVKCPRNEFMNPCPSACFGDACGELDEETATCNTLVAVECRPRCMCRKGYQRDGSGNCIPKAECPVILVS